MTAARKPAVWFPAVLSGSGADIFTQRLASELQKRGIRAEITWLPLRAEYAPWTVSVPCPPQWANIAHVNTWLNSRFLPMNLPIVATLHHAIHTPGLEPYKGRLRSLYHRYWIRPAERRTVQRADVVVAVSKFAAEAARRALFDRSMTVIYNGVDIERFHPPRERKPHQPFRLLYVGKWTTMKGADLLAPIMRELGNDFELRYTGDPSAGRDPAATPTNMHDIGRLRSDNDIVAAMQGADALLFPSRCEGFGLVVVEAMACGLPVIGTRGSSLLEIIDDRATGALCRMDDVFSYAEEGRALMRHPERTARMSSMARDRAEARFSIKHMVDAYVSLYEKHRI